MPLVFEIRNKECGYLMWLRERWARIAQRRGKATAVVALARKLAGIMFAVWRDGTQVEYR